MIDRKLDQLLQEQFVYDAPSKLKYNSLSEAQKMNLTKGLIDSTYRLVMYKADQCDYSIVEGTKGSIHKLPGYSDLVSTIDTLKGMQSMGNRNIEGIAVVDAALTNLRNFEPYFRKAFAMNCSIIELIYNNVVIALISSVAYLVSTAVDMVKQDSGLVQVSVNPRSAKGLDTAMLQALAKFNKLCMNGEMTKFINKALPESVKAGLTGADVVNMGGQLLAQGATIGRSVLMVTVVIQIFLAILLMLRQIVYQFYNTRVKIADYLRTNATFLELNQNKLMSGANMQKVAKRQQNLAETLSKLADKVDIDQKASTKKANLELRDDLSQAGGMDMSSPEDDLLF